MSAQDDYRSFVFTIMQAKLGATQYDIYVKLRDAAQIESSAEYARLQAENAAKDALSIEFRERCETAVIELRRLIPTQIGAHNFARLNGKVEGVKLALDYFIELSDLYATALKEADNG